MGSEGVAPCICNLGMYQMEVGGHHRAQTTLLPENEYSNPDTNVYNF